MLACAATWLSLASSCSLVAITKYDPELDPPNVEDCTASYGVPALDGGTAVLFGASAVTLHSTAESDNSFRTMGWVATGLAVAYIAATGYGASKVARCRGAKKQNQVDRPMPYQALPGQAGSDCKTDQDCLGSLVCDVNIRTCVPAPGTTAPDPLENLP